MLCFPQNPFLGSSFPWILLLCHWAAISSSYPVFSLNLSLFIMPCHQVGRTQTRLQEQINPIIHWLRHSFLSCITVQRYVCGPGWLSVSTPKGCPETQVPFTFGLCHLLSRQSGLANHIHILGHRNWGERKWRATNFLQTVSVTQVRFSSHLLCRVSALVSCGHQGGRWCSGSGGSSSVSRCRCHSETGSPCM